MNFTVVIPARWASTRLPGKPLVDLAGQPLLQRVHALALQAGADRVIVATDDDRILQAARAFGADAVMTSSACRTGTDRVFEVTQSLDLPADAIVLNLQGDEPSVPPALLRQVVAALVAAPGAGMATAACPVRSTSEAHDPNVVKVVLDADLNALYFSRAAIPWDRAGDGRDTSSMLRHIGLYAYRVHALQRLAGLPQSQLERVESLEQLRALQHGIGITVAVTDEPPPGGVDSPEDLERLRGAFQSG